MDLPVNSLVEGIRWPAVPTTQAASRLSLLFQLEQSQWWSQERLLRHQLDQLEILLRYAKSRVPYYRHVLSDVSVDDKLDIETWRKLPILSRDRLQEAGNALQTEILPKEHGRSYQQKTSGSTGKPVETMQTDIDHLYRATLVLRIMHWHRMDMSKSMAVIRHMASLGDFKAADTDGTAKAPNWGPASLGVYDTSACYGMDIHKPIKQQLGWLEQLQPSYLQTYPTVLQELILESRRQGVTLHKLEKVLTISEALPDGLRDLCRSEWGVELVDAYSTIELGALAYQCPEQGHYHEQSESVFIEVLRDDDTPCEPGETGRVVVTNLHNFATPLIRYEVGDYAEVGAPCSCGRGLPVLKRILGRYRNLITLPGGEKYWPQFGIADMLKIAPVKQYRAIQHELERIEYQLVTERPLTADQRQSLRSLFESRLPDGFSIELSEVDDIPRSSSGKYEEFVSHL